MSETQKAGLALLREPFPAHQISKLPKPTKQQTDEVKADYKKGIRCDICGGWHHPKVVHLDYVGHAALTARLLDADINWHWEPLAIGPDGLPVIDKDGGLWIKLTVCGVARLGYGDAQGKAGGDAMKERIGDALRNAAMRFGAALELWHKGDLYLDEAEPAATLQQPSVSAKSVALDTWEKMSEEEKSYLADLAAVVAYDLSQGNADVAREKLSKLDADEKAAIWSRFDSKQRAQLKNKPSQS